MGSDGWYLTTDPENLIDPDKKYVSLPAAGPGQIASYEVLQKDRDTSYTFENGILTIHKGTFTGNDYAHNSFMAAVIKMAGNKLNIKKLVAEKDVIFTDSCSYLFQSFENVEEIDLSQADMTEVTYANNMFSICPSLRSVKMGKTSNKLINISDIFENLNNLQTVDLSNLDTSGVTSMNGMFRYCNSLKSVDLSNLDTSQVTDMSLMFTGCSSIQRIDLSKNNLSSLTNVEYMFSNATALESIDFNDTLKSAKITDFDYMFTKCTSLHTLDLSNFDFSKASSFTRIFDGADIRRITIPSTLAITTSLSLHNTGVSPDHSLIFKGWSKEGSDTIISGTGTNAAFSGEGTYVLKYEDKGFVYEVDGDTLTLKEGTYGQIEREYYKDIASIVNYIKDTTGVTIKKIIVEEKSVLDDVSDIFSQCTDVEEIDLSKTVFSTRKNMSYMLPNGSNLKKITFMPNKTFSAVTNMASMFYNCTSLESIDLSAFRTSDVTLFSNMFYNCKSFLRSI